MALPTSRQYWSSTQKEVWKNVETYTDLIMKGEVERFLDYFHQKYSGWNNYQPMPANKCDVKNELWHLSMKEIDSYTISPVAINIFNDVAIVHYYYSAASKSLQGRKKRIIGRNTDILLKQKERWVLIGDHVGGLGDRSRKKTPENQS